MSQHQVPLWSKLCSVLLPYSKLSAGSLGSAMPLWMLWNAALPGVPGSRARVGEFLLPQLPSLSLNAFKKSTPTSTAAPPGPPPPAQPSVGDHGQASSTVPPFVPTPEGTSSSSSTPFSFSSVSEAAQRARERLAQGSRDAERSGKKFGGSTVSHIFTRFLSTIPSLAYRC